jgi:hypothetical protein
MYTRHLSGDAYEKIEKSKLLELIVTDSIPLKKESKKNKSAKLCTTFCKLCTWYIIIIPLAENLSCKKKRARGLTIIAIK